MKKAERQEKAGKGGIGGFGYAISLLGGIKVIKVSLFIVLPQIFRVVIYCNTALKSSNPDT